MSKLLSLVVVTTALSFSVVTADAGGWGKRGQRGYHDNHNNYSSGLLNVSPDLDLGDINLLNGNSILSGNRTSIGNGILGGALIGILGGNSYTSKHSVKKSKRGRGRR